MENQTTTTELQPLTTGYNIKGQRMIKDHNTDKTWVSLIEDAEFRSAIASLYDFTVETDADCDMAYDWVCEMLDIDSFVDNKTAWDSFYETWESCDNRNCTEYNFA